MSTHNLLKNYYKKMATVGTGLTTQPATTTTAQPATTTTAPSTLGSGIDVSSTGAVTTAASTDTVLYGPRPVKRLTSGDFDLTGPVPIALKTGACAIVLFYIDNDESKKLGIIFAAATRSVAGPIFAAVDLNAHEEVAQAMTTLSGDANSPYKDLGLNQIPVIIAYRSRLPAAVYNAARANQPLADWAVTRACKAGYFELIQVGGGVQADQQLEMPPYQPYINIPGQPPVQHTVSSQYTQQAPIRGFNSTLPVTVVGSPAATANLNVLRSEEARQQASAAQGVNASLTPVQEGATVTPTTARPTLGAPPVSSLAPAAATQ